MQLGLFASAFTLVAFSDSLLTTINEISLYFLLFIYVAMYARIRPRIKKIILITIATIGCAMVILPINVLYGGFDNQMPIKYYNTNNFGFIEFGGMFFILFLESTFAYIITIWYYKRKHVTISEGQSGDELEPMFNYFLTDINVRKFTILAVMLIMASFYEEIIFRYLLLNITTSIGVPIWIGIIIVGVMFGYAHKNNGYMGYVFSSVVSGAVFAFVFYNWGLGPSWALHLAWNALVVLDEYITIWATKREK